MFFPLTKSLAWVLALSIVQGTAAMAQQPKPASTPWSNSPSLNRQGAINLSATNTRTTPITLWATYYYVHRARSISNGYPLLSASNTSLGPTLSKRDWCYAALQGTVVVPNDRGVPITYNFTGRGSRSQVNCSAFFSSLSAATIQAMSRARFVVATAPYGYGTNGFQLVPFRTIAVDRTRIPIGSVVYIPQARGVTVTLPSGESFVHDGYFYAADVGRAIRGNHIDVFIGTAERNPFRFIASRASGTFQAYVVENTELSQVLRALHRNPSR
ncbi:hypothetical protein H6F43_15950 [Leptolyngbya sp. FACHB-36]|uniref:3D domain-containing protein n=1 Tax=Leptolyngbya sp. FACHB-36 TaxID=2692808 RepID=UPI001681C038|nr:3D domain-containing protein [Leptolyngbya sp. FACHB-36]MBD2021673.1 hypothetical protein [Leptolyngbya sp. FACHB-36]